MLHRYTDYAVVEDNKCLGNGDAGIAIFDSDHNTVRRNTCWRNFKSGMRVSVGSADNLIENNDLAFSDNFGFYLYKGNDAPRPGGDGRPKRNRFVNNQVHDNGSSGIFVTSGDDNVFTANLLWANFGPLSFLNARRNLLDSNSIPSGVIVATKGSPGFASTTSIRNQPSLSIQVDAYSSTIFQDTSGRVFDAGQDLTSTTVTPSGTMLELTAAEIPENTTVWTRNFQAVPDAGLALIAMSIWNTSGDLSKRWLVQAGSATHAISYKVGDLAPNKTYNVLKNGVASRVTSDDAGSISFQDNTINVGLTEYVVSP
jgi:parallel beta-helix repeat protein